MKKLFQKFTNVSQTFGFGTSVPSPFQSTLETLVARDKELNHSQRNADASTRNLSASNGSLKERELTTVENVPVILQQFVHYLESPEALSTEGIFRLAGSMRLIKELREEIEKANAMEINRFESDTIIAVAGLLKQFLRDVSDGLVPKKYFQGLIDAGSSVPKIRDVINSMTPIHRSSLEYLLRFLLKVASHSHENKMGIQNLVIVFAPNVFRCPSAPHGANKGYPEKYLVESMQATKCLVTILENFKEIFGGEEVETPQSHQPKVLSKSVENLKSSSTDVKDSTPTLVDSNPAIHNPGHQPGGVAPNHSRRSTSEFSWAVDSTGRSTPASTAPPSPTLSQKNNIDAAVKASVGSILFGRPASQPNRGSLGQTSRRQQQHIPAPRELEKGGRTGEVSHRVSFKSEEKEEEEEKRIEYQDETYDEGEEYQEDEEEHAIETEIVASWSPKSVSFRDERQHAFENQEEYEEDEHADEEEEERDIDERDLRDGDEEEYREEFEDEEREEEEVAMRDYPDRSVDGEEEQEEEEEMDDRADVEEEDLGSMNELDVPVPPPTLQNHQAPHQRQQNLEDPLFNRRSDFRVPERSPSPVDLAMRGIGRTHVSSSFDEIHQNRAASPRLSTLSPSRTLTSSPDRLLTPLKHTTSKKDNALSASSTRTSHQQTLSASSPDISNIASSSKRLQRRRNSAGSNSGGGSRSITPTQLAPISAPSNANGASASLRRNSAGPNGVDVSKLDALLSRSEELLREKNRSDYQFRTGGGGQRPLSSGKQIDKYSTAAKKSSVSDLRGSVSSQNSDGFPSFGNAIENMSKEQATEAFKVLKDRLIRMKVAGISASREEKDQLKRLLAFLKDGKQSQQNSFSKDFDMSRDISESNATLSSSLKSVVNPCEAALARLAQKRSRDGRPADVGQMTAEQMITEKSVVKRELSQLKSLFANSKSGGPSPTDDERSTMRDLYNRYCQLKSALESGTNTTSRHALSSPSDPPHSTSSHSFLRPHSTQNGTEDKMKSYKRLRYEKKLLQIQLHKYQEDFKKLNGRMIKTAEDRAPIRVEYKRYKELREVLGRMEAELGIQRQGD
ncbi:Protein fam13a [Chytridiales sp. JEL 0842]|nr:Protein fam13a [Chytridiales sp. JEL 0842]